jgi:asparagine synthase (glutamine-hydrolysing)
MCGILGIVGSKAPGRGLAMLDALRRRGPDDSGLVNLEGATLGMTRLAITDPGPTGHQPMAGPDGDVHIVYNGEIYNYREHRARLAQGGWTFRSESDTEVLLALYYRYADECVRHLRGMFAFAIHDRRGGPGRERVLLARDHFGIKPLLYADSPTGFVFASELKAILASGLVRSEVDPAALFDLLARGSVMQPRTILKGVHALLPAHRMVIEQGTRRIERYWSLGTDRIPGLRRGTIEEAERRVEAALVESMALQQAADVPVGAFLSGGVDSSLLVAMMARRNSGRLKTYSMGFAEEGRTIDETDDALAVARFLGTEHTRLEVTGRDVAGHLDRLGAALDQPSVDGVNAYFISMAAGRDLKVAVSGTGSDELFAGYPWFKAMQDSDPERTGLRRFLGMFGGKSPPKTFLDTYASTYQIHGAAGAWALLHRDVRESLGRPPDIVAGLSSTDELSETSTLDRVTGLCLNGYTRNQLLRDIDAMSMAHSLEVRVPFLDPDVADVALSLPPAARLSPPRADAPPGSYRATGAKHVILRLAARWLPPNFDLRAKRGFGLPMDAWLNGDLKDVCDEALSPSCVAGRGWLDERAVSATLTSFRTGQLHWSLPWVLLSLELWGRQVLDRHQS